MSYSEKVYSDVRDRGGFFGYFFRFFPSRRLDLGDRDVKFMVTLINSICVRNVWSFSVIDNLYTESSKFEEIRR